MVTNKKIFLSSLLVIICCIILLSPDIVYGENDNSYVTYDRNHGSSGNFFDDFIDHDKDNDNQIDESDVDYTDDLGLAAGIQTKTDVYSDIALVLAVIAGIMSLCFFIMYIKRNRNHY